MKLPHSLFTVFLIFFIMPSNANLQLDDSGNTINIPLKILQQYSKTEFTLFSPDQKREVHIKGILLENLLQKYLTKVPDQVSLIAIDGYKQTFKNWQRNHWVIVTSEDGKPLSLKKKGPLKLVERSYSKKRLKNLRNFNQWIWMLQRIETE